MSRLQWLNILAYSLPLLCITTNKAILEVALLESAVNKEAEIYKTDNYGTQYDVKFFMTTETGSSWVLSCWMIRTDEDFPRLTNTYPVNK